MILSKRTNIGFIEPDVLGGGNVITNLLLVICIRNGVVTVVTETALAKRVGALSPNINPIAKELCIETAGK